MRIRGSLRRCWGRGLRWSLVEMAGVGKFEEAMGF